MDRSVEGARLNASSSRLPALPPSSPVPSSEAGEIEEARAGLLGRRYWAGLQTREDGLQERGGNDEFEANLSSEDELAMSPVRPQARTLASSAERRRRAPSPSLAVPAFRRSSSRRPHSPSDRPSPEPSLPHPDEVLRKPRRSTSPTLSDASSHVLDMIARPRKPVQSRPSRPSRSPSPPDTRTPTPPPRKRPRTATPPPSSSSRASSPVHIPPDAAHLVAGRALRTRTVAQLKPYSVEQLKYTKTLLKNGWEGAVVRTKRPVEETAEDLQRKKEELARRPKDSLGGWLVSDEEDGTGDSPPRLQDGSLGSADPSSGLQSDEDGMTLLEREARRKERMELAVAAAMGGNGKKRPYSPHRHGPSRIDNPPHRTKGPQSRKKRPEAVSDDDSSDSSTTTTTSSQQKRRRPRRAESAPPSSSPAHTPRKKTASKRRRFADRHGSGSAAAAPRRPASSARRQIRADSEPPTSSPARQPVGMATKPRNMAKPSKSVHRRAGSGERSALDRDILNLPSPSRWRSDGESDLPSDEEEEEDEEEGGADEESQSPDRQLGPSRLELSHKRKRALGAMMPAVFLKKAAKDLKLMAREREVGEYSSGSELNSGDEEAVERASKNRAKKRIVPGDAPMRFDGEAFTDESGDDPDQSDDGLGEKDEEDENDAVSSWLQSFAPRRTNAAEEDIVDRFLKRAKRPPPKKRKAGKGAGSRARPSAEGSTKDKKEGREERAALQETGNYVVGYRPLDGPAAPKRKPRSVPLDTDDAIFAFVRQQELTGAGMDGDNVVVIAPPVKPRSAAEQLPPNRVDAISTSVHAVPATDLRNDEAWATFGKFSPDFGLDRLPPGIRFSSPSSFVANGHLYSLVNPTVNVASFSCDVYGLHLSPSTSLEQLESHLPAICDDILEDLARLGKEDERLDSLADAGKVLQYLGMRIDTATGAEAAKTGPAILASLERLEDRLNASPVFQAAGKDFRRGRVLVGWYLVDIAARVQRTTSGAVDERRLQQRVKSLVQNLLRHGQDRTVKVLKAASSGDRLTADGTVEAWLGLISLALKSDSFGQTALTVDVLWRIVEEEVRAGLSATAQKGPAGGEILAYTTLMLCAISQFSPSGVSTSTPRLPAHWTAVMATLDVIQPSALAAPDYNLSSTAVARRDRYLWTLFARCLVLAERWGWRVDVKDDLLPRLFDLLNARRLSDLTTETSGDFPEFLQDLNKFGDARLDRSTDTAFSIFLKLVIAAAQGLPATSDADKRRRGAQFTRLFLRLSPMVSASWSRQSIELTRSGSILVNHYSLDLAFAMLHPSGAGQRVEHARRLVSFADVDEEARRTCIRAILYFAAVFRHHDLPLKPIVEWLASIADMLKAEYTDIERQRRKEEYRLSKERSKSAGGKGDPLWQRAVLLTMVLRSVQVILRFKKAGDAAPSYPDAALLHPSWTSHLLDSPLALDPMIGREAIKVIDCFLDVRRAALPRKNVAQAANDGGQGESQDDFGTFDDLDFDDPTLNAMLGIEGEAADTGGGDDALRASDKACAELLKTTITPAFFRLVSNIFVSSSGSGPTIADRVSYAQYAVECWVRCAAVAVENGVADWRPYLQYGAQSWKRLSDPVGRRDIGLFLIIEILKHDPAAYTVFAEDVLEIWFESIVARRLTSQHILTETLLNVDVENVGTVSPLFEGVPFDRSASSGKVEVEQLDLLDKRPDLLKTIFENAARLATASTASTLPPSTAQLLGRAGSAPIRPTISRGTIMNLLRSMLASLRDNLAAIHDETTRRNYSTFVRSTLAALTAAGAVQPSGFQPGKRGPFNETTLPDIAVLRSSAAS
ncbi:hypothetical protein RTG_02578 [Rhodotorula toruloides ATCC 204091]|uniref:Mus7/MMS22 family-domain containing protein n=1 Tax=Rhodotorula toruloides TaxID=5286 RepID=A0A0K3CN53_RHOTO|nr:hypothetical protein RTG_02578 [Rhodotorula toruloides ATCC 204091]PRQ71003.1 Mus7/MMS22 family-domain containing protein [Rhodotorula toruloides]